MRIAARNPACQNDHHIDSRIRWEKYIAQTSALHREWARRGAMTRLQEIDREKAAIFSSFPELRRSTDKARLRRPAARETPKDVSRRTPADGRRHETGPGQTKSGREIDRSTGRIGPHGHPAGCSPVVNVGIPL